MSVAPWRVIAPAPAGVFDGIGDFSALLAGALQPFHPTELFVRAETWRELERCDIQNTAGAIVQYLPQAFMRGDMRALLRWLDRVRAAGKPVVLTVHEYWPPLDGTVRRAAIRWMFRRMLRACARRSTAIVTSQEFSAADIASTVGRRPVIAIPVGSAIPRVAHGEHPLADGATCRLVVFGQPAALHDATFRAVAQWLSTAPRGITLTWLGRSSEEMRARWCDVWQQPADRVTFAGGLAAADLSAILTSSQVGIAPYENGASTRRTSFAAMMEHRLPVVAVDGLYTSDWLRQSGACVWTPEGQPAAFVRALQDLVSDHHKQSALAVEAGTLFETRLSWPRIGALYAQLLAEGARQ